MLWKLRFVKKLKCEISLKIFCDYKFCTGIFAFAKMCKLRLSFLISEARKLWTWQDFVIFEHEDERKHDLAVGFSKWEEIFDDIDDSEKTMSFYICDSTHHQKYYCDWHKWLGWKHIFEFKNLYQTRRKINRHYCSKITENIVSMGRF